ncbi:hypothetical protein EIP91_008005 [Steccherinum ochraceum]|uniref:NADP-dependent oxidoreductase domain-containing protein n=1 Tax=Steccherinum ochraceum TaxID=92696 RepID=A0A4R0RBM4_9APHY|nr:hypothetical protein EIP91_008005 [Steccherinum ochraceum]
MSEQPKSQLNVILGTMTYGKPGIPNTLVNDVKDVETILDIFQQHGHTDLDTARSYGQGTSEEYLAAAGWKKRGLQVSSKFFPTIMYGIDMPGLTSSTPEELRKQVDNALKALDTDSMDIFYLHVPDRTVPFEVTHKALDELYKEGKFKRLGLSNFASWEVAEVVTLCKANQWIVPSVYQCAYNVVERGIEPELLPCLRKFGIKFFAYCPLAAGFFTGRYLSETTTDVAPNSRFDSATQIGAYFRSRYWNERHFKAIEITKAAVEKAGLTIPEAALRWLSHHSALKKEHGDAIIIGGSSVKHVQQNLDALDKGPLPEEVVKALDEAYDVVKAKQTKYFY